jgi:hypothetical protein
LKKLGYQFDLVDSTLAALMRLKSNHYQLIFLNLNLFCRHDFQILSSIVILEKSLGRQTPVIGMQCDNSQLREQPRTETSLILKAIINKASIEDVVDVIQAFAKPKIGPDLAITAPLVTDKTAMSIAQLQTGMHEFDASMTLLAGALKTVLSCLKLAIEEQDCANLVFLAKSLQHSCRKVGLVSIERIAAQLIAEARNNRWVRVANLMQILNAQCTAAIAHLKSDFDVPSAL